MPRSGRAEFTTVGLLVLVALVTLGCGASSASEEESRPPPPDTGGGEQSEERVDDGRQFFALPNDGSLGDLEALLTRRRDEGEPVQRIVIHTARSARADDAASYLDAIRALVRGLRLDPEVLIGAPADSPHLTIVTRHPAPVGR